MWRTDFDDGEFQKVFEFFYEARDVRDKQIHPAVFPISLAKKIIGLFTHEGELVVDPFLGIGTTLVAARDLHRNAVGFDINQRYVDFSDGRLRQVPRMRGTSSCRSLMTHATSISTSSQRRSSWPLHRPPTPTCSTDPG